MHTEMNFESNGICIGSVNKQMISHESQLIPNDSMSLSENSNKTKLKEKKKIVKFLMWTL